MHSIVEASAPQAVLKPKARKEAKPVEVTLFFVAAALWVVFAVAVLVSQSSLDDVWAWFKGQSLLLQVPLGILFLPWVIGMWIWESTWSLAARSVLVAGIAWANLYSFFPWKSA
jgi:hypothetical protein